MEYPLHTAPVILKQYLGSVLDLQLYFVDSHQLAFSKKNMLVYTHLKFTWNSTSKSGTRKTTKMFPMKNVIMITNTTQTQERLEQKNGCVKCYTRRGSFDGHHLFI